MRRVNSCGFTHVPLLLLLLVHFACSPSPSSGELSQGGCAHDGSCPVGQECSTGGCLDARPTIYSHIQLASPRFSAPFNDSESAWRATHNDIIVGRPHPDLMRSENPNIRLFAYFNIRHYRYQISGVPWAAARNVREEDFYLHYREDVSIPGYETAVLVTGYPAGIIPGWNPNRNPGDPPASATERSHSRVHDLTDPHPEPWYLANMASEPYRRFVLDYVAGLIDGSTYNNTFADGPLEGVIVDHAIYYPVFNVGYIDKTAEFYGVPLDDNHPYAAAFESFYPVLQRELNARFGAGTDVMLNYGHVYFLSRPDRFSQNVQKTTGWIWGEVWLTHQAYSSPTSGSARTITWDVDYRNGLANIVRQSRAGGRRVLGARDFSGGVPGTDRGKIYTLALYYLIQNKNTFYTYESVPYHLYTADISQWQWNPAVTYDIGVPAPVPPEFTDFDGNAGSKEHYIMDSGGDPYDSTLTYYVLARNYTRGLVLAKMLPKGSVVDDRSATSHPLDRPYAVLGADGSPGPVVTEITLRNNEGAILVLP